MAATLGSGAALPRPLRAGGPAALAALLISVAPRLCSASEIAVAAASTSNSSSSHGYTCDEAAWPDKDHNLICGECKVLVNRFDSFYGSCRRYCRTVGRQCVGAWEEVNEDCNVKHEMTCDQTISSSDAICECGAEVSTVLIDTCATGFEIAVGDIPGWGEINGKGGGQQVENCHECAELCRSEAMCHSYECSPSTLNCSLNVELTPAGSPFLDYMFCQMEVPQCVGCSNRPSECWAACGGRGFCDACSSYKGTRGACCMSSGGSHDPDDPAECQSVELSDFQYEGYHMCVLVKETAPEVPECAGCRGKTSECWRPCDRTRGYCSACDSAEGSKGACCMAKRGRHDPDDPAECQSVPLSNFLFEGYHMCVLVNDVPEESKDQGFGWHTWALVASVSGSGWAWDVVRAKFISTAGQEVSPSTPGCHVLHSGHPAESSGYDAGNAFKDDDSWWGGRQEGTPGKFYIGITCNKDHSIAAVQLEQVTSSEHTVSQVQVYHNQWLVASKRVTSGWLQTVWAGPFGVRLEAEELYATGWRRFVRKWEVQRVKVMVHPDDSIGFDGGELRPGHGDPFGCEVVESSPRDTEGYEAENAFEDSGEWWMGKKGPVGNFFIGLECARPFPWPLPQVYLQQRDQNYATEVKLQVKTAFGWKTKDTMNAGPNQLLPLL